MTVGELLGRMSSREISEWAVYFKLEAAEHNAGSGQGQTTNFSNSSAVTTMGGQSFPDE